MSPVDGGKLAKGSTGPVVIDFPTAGEYDVSVLCPDYSYYWDGTRYFDGRESIQIPRLVDEWGDDLTGAYCEISVRATDSSGLSAYSSFTVAPPSLTVSDIRASGTTFYPRVRDGYLDKVALRIDLNRAAGVAWQVNDIDGRVVRRATTSASAGAHVWRWDGKSSSGALLKPGAYRAVVTVTAGGVSRTRSIVVRIATAVITRTITKRKDGYDANYATRGRCYVEQAYADDDYSVTLDCWGGRYAQATYVFAIPSNATNIRWAVRSYLSGADLCCRGSVSKSGARVSSTRYHIRAKVTGLRAMTVERVAVTYSYRTRV